MRWARGGKGGKGGIVMGMRFEYLGRDVVFGMRWMVWGCNIKILVV